MNSGFEEITTMNKIFESKLDLVNKEIAIMRTLWKKELI
jgi:hypothetical protein